MSDEHRIVKNSEAIAEIDRLRQILRRIEGLPPGATLEIARAIAKEGLVG